MGFAMICEGVQELIPLYLEGDLPSHKQSRIRQHLEECASCRTLLDDLRNTQRWLRASTPDISGAMLETLRRAVWQRIAVEPPPSPVRRRLERAWASLRHWAAQPSVATLAVVMVLLGSFGLSRAVGPGTRTFIPSGPEELTGEGTSGATAEGNDPLLDEGLSGPSPEDPANDRLLAQADADEGAELSDASGEIPEEGKSAEDALRIEIQTRDPNVRIIWFSPQGDEPAPVED